MSAGDVATAVAAGVVAGILAGILGTGGGFLTVPVMVLLLGRDQTVAQGTSLLAIVGTAVVGTWGHARRRAMPWPTIARLGAAGVAGAVAGAALALRVFGDDALRRIFGVFLMVTALRAVLRLRAEGRDR